MIYARDTAVEYPIADLYDSGMMNAYLTAVRGEYERGIKEQEEFMSKYGDFISPFQKDVETWDRLTIDPIVEAYDALTSAGIDPLRSQEGRAILASVRRRVPRETLSQLRLSAAAGLEYLKNRGELQAKGLYDPTFEDFLLNGVSFNDYDTTKQGMWSRVSPTEFKGLRTITDPWFKNRQPKYKYTKDGYDYYGYDENDMRTAVNDLMLAFLANDYGRFYYDRALRTARSIATPGESEESIQQRARDILVNDIVNVNHDYLLNDRKENAYALADYKFRQQAALEGMRHRNALREAQAAQENINPYPASWTGLLTDEINKKKGNSKRDQLIAGIQDLIESNQAEMNKYVIPGGKVLKKDLLKYKFHKKQRDWYRDYLNNVNSGKAGFTRNKFGNYDFTDRARYVINRYNKKQQKGRGTIENQTDWLNNNSIEITEPNSRRWALQYVSESPVEITSASGVQEPRLMMTFGGANNITRVRTGKIMGTPLISNSVSVKFNNYLRRNKIVGYADPTSIKVSKTSKPNGGSSYDFTYYVDVPKLVLYDFMKIHVDKNGNMDDDNKNVYEYTMQNLGASTYQYTNGTGANQKTVDMIRIPVTKTATDGDLNSFQNSMIDKEMYGASNAYNLAPNRQGEGILNSYR